MLDALRHKSSYQTGMWIDESLGLYLGWTVHKGAFADCMPISHEGGNSILLFSGEEYSPTGGFYLFKGLPAAANPQGPTQFRDLQD